jgi:FkbM family methyltransferase
LLILSFVPTSFFEYARKIPKAREKQIHANRVFGMKIQNVFLWAYKKAQKFGFWESKLGKEFFYKAYDLYKLLVEAGPIEQLKPFSKPETVVIDVGANVGFFTTRFIQWLAPTGGKVIALEPEARNYQRLVNVIQRQGYTKDVIETLNCAVAEQNGIMYLAINPMHPGDHHLDESGIPVDVVTIDYLLSVRGWPTVSLIKIDVQGAELRVLLGAQETLNRYSPALFIEVDDNNLRSYGTSASKLLELLDEMGYKPHQLRKYESPLEVSTANVLELLHMKTYLDILFIKSK